MAKRDRTSTAEGRDLEVLLEETEAWTRRLTVTVAPDRVTRERVRQRRRLASNLNLPGFRKGKVPDRVVEERFGPLVDQRTVGALVEAAYQEAVQREQLQPIADPEFGDVQYKGAGEPLTFQVEVEVMPVLRLERTGGFRLKRPQVAVSDREVDEILERLRKERSLWEPVERPPVPGDSVSVRITRLDGESSGAAEPEGGGGTEPEGGTEPDAGTEMEGGAQATAEEETDPAIGPEQASDARPYRFELGEGYAIPDVEEAIKTLEPGGSGEFDVGFPDDFDDESLAGHRRRLRIELLEVKQRRPPELDDEFASEVGDFESLEALRGAVREDVRRHKEEEAEGTVRDQLLDSIVEANPFQVPRRLVERYLDQVIEAPEGADPEKIQAARRSLEPAAERQIKRQMVLDRVIELESLEASDEELEARLRELAERRGAQPAELRRALKRENRLSDLRRQVTVGKAFEWLKGRSEVQEP